MFVKALIRMACLIALGMVASGATAVESAEQVSGKVGLQEIRNATIKLDYGDVTFLVDPMLGEQGSYAAAPGALNEQLRNPLVDLPIPVADVMKADALIVTHLHIDHFDEAAKKLLPKRLPVFAQNEQDAEQIRSAGFQDVRVMGDGSEFKGVRLTRTDGQHGSDATLAVRGKQLGKVSGFVLQRPGFKTVYVAGDTVWNGSVEKAIARYTPGVIVLNAGYVRFTDIEGAVIMGKEDLQRAARAAPDAYIVASHLEALGHSTQSRRELRDFIAEHTLDPQRVLVPDDGQAYSF